VSIQDEHGLTVNQILHGSRRLAGSQINLEEIRKAALQTVAPVAYIIVCGEALHNLLDGLSIGAAFSETFLKGASLSLAIICEEFPHKLGDFAILLASGLSFKKALLLNFLASALIFIGVALGITLGENLKVNQWIYAFAAGMFLYVSVCDMVNKLI
jgi:zinc transporter ZupT